MAVEWAIMSDDLQATSAVKGRNLYFFTEPSELDFTESPVAAKAVFSTEDGSRVMIPLPKAANQFPEFLSRWRSAMEGDQVMMTWNIKSFLSYVSKMSGLPFSFGRDTYDLSILAGFCGFTETMPTTFSSAMELFQRIVKANEKAIKWHDEVYLPLATEVLPAIETQGLIDMRTRKVVYPSYTVEGQVNGRLTCSKRFRNSYNPHSLREDDETNLKPVGYGKVFLLLDYRHLEVSVLQWVSGDPALRRMQDSGKDLYDGIWEEVTGEESSPETREICKGFFLPVVYGMGAPTLAKKLKVDDDIAAKIIDNMYKSFPLAMEYVRSKQREADSMGSATDWCGRRRIFVDRSYLARDFCIQAPASTACLYKLLKLHRNLENSSRIVYHCHDGYCIIADRKSAVRVLEKSQELLEAPEEEFPGLRLVCKGKSGELLATLK